MTGDIIYVDQGHGTDHLFKIPVPVRGDSKGGESAASRLRDQASVFYKSNRPHYPGGRVEFSKFYM